MTAAYSKLEEELKSTQSALDSHQRGIEEAQDAHTKAAESIAELRAAKVADDSVLAQVKAELAEKEQLLSQAMTDIQTAAQVEERLRSREREIEQIKADHDEHLAVLQEQSSGSDDVVKAKHTAEVKVSCP